MTVVNVCYGRFNPLHRGHEEMFKFARDLEGDFKIFPTKTQNKQTDPLSFDEKVELIDRAGFDPIFEAPTQTLFGIIEYLEDLNQFDQINFVVGGDRNDEFRRLLQRYQDDYDIKLEVVNFAGRDKYNISATEMRNFCKIGDYMSFIENSPSRLSPNQALEVYRKVSIALQGHVKPPHDKTRSVFFSQAVSNQ